MQNSPSSACEVAIVGGGPAGLSAALVLARCRRRVLLFDHGKYRNAASRAVHGFLSRDGTPPAELRRIAHEQLARYPNVEIRERKVKAARRAEAGFELELDGLDGETICARKLILATGLIDHSPKVAGMEELLGLSVFHCVYCDGWEQRDEPLVAYACGDSGARFALNLTQWSRDVALCTDGSDEPISPSSYERLQCRGVRILTERIQIVEGDASGLRLRFCDGTEIERRALFYSLGAHARSELAQMLGCVFDEQGGIEVAKKETAVNVPGLFVIGDASRDALQAIVGAGEGSKAAIAVNSELTQEDVSAEVTRSAEAHVPDARRSA